MFAVDVYESSSNEGDVQKFRYYSSDRPTWVTYTTENGEDTEVVVMARFTPTNTPDYGSPIEVPKERVAAVLELPDDAAPAPQA